jgi:hypothetical protein
MAKYMTPEDVAEDKASKRAGAAYDKAMPEPDTTFNRMKKTPARRTAEQMEAERTSPMAAKLAKKLSDTPLEERKAGHALQSGMGIPYAMGVDMITGPKRRSDEDMSELTREVAKGKKMASGGSTSASKRADGIAQRGKTRGKMC